ncbi:hypothetical protein Vretifemale_20380 [Volvox reticuliferus]|uniref:Uncharacterized protein n=1 Tax=Volvox reticuliferus TaxID=1737510 RepID=A0A8J4D159_9CHLO|nr:hypothetical protein Vretifemale_20380 [Volvox reticuliferus]
MRLQETFGRVSNPCLYTVLLGGFAELQQRQRERGRAAGASESLTAGDGELPPDGGPHTRKCGFPNELDKLLRKSDVDLVIREFSLKMYQERRRWAQVHIKGDEDSKQRVSRVLKNIMATMGIDREAHQKMDKTVRLQLHDRIYKKIRTCMHRIYLQSKLPKWFEDTCESHGIEMWHLNEGISSGMKDGLTEVDIMDNIVTATGVEAMAERQQQLQGHEHQYGGRWCQDRDNHDSDIRSKSKQRHLHIRSQQPGQRCTYGRAAGNDQSQVRGAQLAAHQNRCNPDAPSTSRGEAGAAARAPEDRRRSGRGTVGSQYDLPQHIAPAGMVETMERGPQPPPPPQQTHGNRVGGAQLAAHQNRCNPDAPSTSRGEAGAAARAPEDRRRSGRGTVGSQYDLPQHIAPAGMVETMERGPQPPPPPQQTHGNRVGDSTMVAAAVLESMRNWQEMDNMQQAGTEDPDCCNDRHLLGAICMNGGASCVQEVYEDGTNGYDFFIPETELQQEELDLAMMPPPLTHKVATIEDHRQKTLDRLLQSQRVTRSSAAAIAVSHGAVGFHVPREALVDRDQRCHEDDEPALKRVRRLKNTQPSCDSTGVGTARVSEKLIRKGKGKLVTDSEMWNTL